MAEPRLDRDARRARLGKAVWSVVRRDGLERASVRNVAAEAGVSMGSLRHDFGTQSELVVYAMRLVIDRIRARIEPLEPASDRRWWVQSVLEELLPLDADRRAESEVWLAFTGRALVDPALRALRDESYDLLRALCQRLVSELAGGLDIEVEAERLYAVVDGLLVHAVMRPDLAPPALVRRVLGRHLDSLA